MDEPIVFISHFRVKADKLEAFRAYFREGAVGLQAAKPRTVAFLAYADETGTRASIVHVFPDADAMDLHFEGAAERSRAAYEFMEPDGWEIYGDPSAAALGMMRAGASAAGVTLTVQPGDIGGFLRLVEASRDR
jgi:quinol monooxygenase YgiN